MLVGFVGAPCSGKTTVAARVFAELKETGLPTEYIVEQARSYIAQKRFPFREQGIKPVLTDADQLAIAKRQYVAERQMNESRVIVVTDSCVLNSLLYMTDEAIQSEEVQALVKAAVAQYDRLFWCWPVPRPPGEDSNRVHDEETSLTVHKRISSLLFPYLTGKVPHPLSGPTHARATEAYALTLSTFAEVVC